MEERKRGMMAKSSKRDLTSHNYNAYLRVHTWIKAVFSRCEDVLIVQNKRPFSMSNRLWR